MLPEDCTIFATRLIAPMLTLSLFADDCHCVIFVLDTSDHSLIADAALELLDALKDPRLAGKPAALVLSKQDRPIVASRAEIEFVMHLDCLERTLDFTVFELSSIPDAAADARGKGKAGSVEESQSGVEALFSWLLEVKGKALGIPIQAKKPSSF